MFSIITYVSMIIVILAIYYLMFVQNKKIVFFDETQSTTKDYSIEITVRTLHVFSSVFTYRLLINSTQHR